MSLHPSMSWLLRVENGLDTNHMGRKYVLDLLRGKELRDVSSMSLSIAEYNPTGNKNTYNARYTRETGASLCCWESRAVES